MHHTTQRQKKRQDQDADWCCISDQSEHVGQKRRLSGGCDSLRISCMGYSRTMISFSLSILMFDSHGVCRSGLFH